MSDASGRVVVLSGATSGIGEAAARALAEAGARLTLVGRNEELLRELASGLGAATDWVVADLVSLEQTRRAAEEIRERHERIDVLINNAGGMFSRRRESPEGLELSLALNQPLAVRADLGAAAAAARRGRGRPRVRRAHRQRGLESRTAPGCGGTTSPPSAGTG